MLGLDAVFEPLPHPHPSEVVVEVLRGNATQLPVGPGLEPIVVIVDRLNVVNALADPAVVADGDGLGRNAELGGSLAQGAAAVDAQEGVRPDSGVRIARKSTVFFWRSLRTRVARKGLTMPGVAGKL